MRRFRWRVWHLILTILAAGIVCGGAELGRRSLKPHPKAVPGWIWYPERIGEFEIRYTNMDDVRNGIDPPKQYTVLIPNPAKILPAAPKPNPKMQTFRLTMKLVRRGTPTPTENMP